MKKISLVFSALLMTLCASAQVYYLLPATGDVNANEVTDVNTYLPEEDGQQPERNAYAWFAENYGANILTIKDVVEGKLLTDGQLGDVKVLWVNVARVGLELSQFDAMFSYDFRNRLGDFVKAGGNVFLSSQSTRLVSEMGRCSWWPNDYQFGEYKSGIIKPENGDEYFDEWNITFNFCTGSDKKEHSVYAKMENLAQKDGVDAIFPMQKGTLRTDNNTGWADWYYYWTNTGHNAETEAVPSGCDAARQSLFEDAQTCQILGGWGHTRGLDYAGFVEFFPKDEFRGTVITMGLAAYQWCNANEDIYNIKNLTKGVLDYLKGSAYWNEGKEPKDSVVGAKSEEAGRCGSDFSGYTVVLASSNPEVATIDQEGTIEYLTEGRTVISATYTGDGFHSCKTPIVLEKEIVVSDKSTALDNAQLLQDGVVYDLLGRRVSEMTAGNMYIINGEKVLLAE